MTAELPVVFLHGLRTSRTMWRAQVAAVEAAGHPAVAIDLPGHGRRRGERFTWDGAIDAVARGVDDGGGRALGGGRLEGSTRPGRHQYHSYCCSRL